MFFKQLFDPASSTSYLIAMAGLPLQRGSAVRA
jgi:hypothetical protein